MSQFVSVRSIASRLKSQFKVEMDIYSVIQGVADALKKMGILALDRSLYTATVDNFCVCLPGTVWKVRGVIRLDEIPKQNLKVEFTDIFFPPQVVFTMEERDTEQEAVLLKNNYVPAFKGPYMDYVWDAPHLKFNETDVPVAIEVTGIKVDEEGFPMVPEAAFFGCMYYCLFVHYQPLFLLGQVTPQMMAQVEKWKDDNVRQSNAAVMRDYLTANERDNVLNILTSMDRKSFNLPA